MKAEARPAREFQFRCPLAAGLHARPASRLAEVAGDFQCETTLRNLRTYALADLKSMLSIIAAEVRYDDPCALHVKGADEEVAFTTLRRFVETELPQCDEPLLQPSLAVGGALPRSLQEAAVRAVVGTPASPGIGRGRIVPLGGFSVPQAVGSEKAADWPTEQSRVDNALAGARVALETQLARRRNATEQALLKAHLALTNDPSLLGRITNLIEHGRSAGQAIVEACEGFISMLRGSESRYIRERALDMQDVAGRLLREIYGENAAGEPLRLTGPSILVAENCTPQQLLSLDREHLRGLVLEAGGATSHTLILARSLGIAALTGVREIAALPAGSEALVDGYRGFVTAEVSPAVERFYERESRIVSWRNARLARFAAAPAITTDGQRLEIGANVAAVEEFAPAFQNGADGIGVFRTEMLFAGRQTLPTEDEQFEAYAAAARAAAGKPVIVRTLDAGGDKPLACLALPQEQNPFLGERGVRLYARHEAVIRSQMRAILRASAHGRVMIMIPMIASLDEVRWCKTLIESVKRDLAAANVTFDDKAPLGIMVEVPSVGFQMEELAREVDFFSVGTNDLAQYFFAADRDNPALAAIANLLAPAFLRFLQQIAEAAHRAGKWIGVCGQMAADPRHLPVMLALGIDEIGVPAASIPDLKERVTRLSAADCRDVFRRAAACATADEAAAVLDEHQGKPLPLIADDLVITSATAQDKDEVIRELAGVLWVAGRVDDRARLEQAVWAREQVYATGVGYGFAVPHCKSDAAHAASIAVLRLAQPVEWGSLDNQPVRMAILLALPENAAKQHLQVFARLARKLMNEDFRNQLLGAPDAAAIRSCLERDVMAEA